MPTDPSVNLTTSAAAAFCARLCVHPLDMIKVVSHHSLPTLSEGRIPPLEHFLASIRQHLHLQQQYEPLNPSRPQSQGRSSKCHSNHSKISIGRGLYGGVSFALAIQVPALAFFLSTYDATKHGLGYLAHRSHIPFFHLHHFETHLVSGMMAKVAGTVLWAPMIKLQAMSALNHAVATKARANASTFSSSSSSPSSSSGSGTRTTGQSFGTHNTTHTKIMAVTQGKSNGKMASSPPPPPLTLRDAFRLAQRVCRSEGFLGLWSGYRQALISLLPYTMLYFATYEQLKQVARRNISSAGTASSSWTVKHSTGLGVKDDKEEEKRGAMARTRSTKDDPTFIQGMWPWRTGSREDHAIVLSTSPLPLDLGTYMVCVAGAVIISAAVCHSGSAARVLIMDRLYPGATHGSTASSSSPSSSAPFRAAVNALSSSSSSSSTYAVGSTAFKAHPLISTHSRPLTTRTATTVLPSTRSKPHPRQPPLNTSLPKDLQEWRMLLMHLKRPRSSSGREGNMAILRTLTRGLGPRILWTAPGVTLTTAGFEVFRNMALGVA